MSIENESVVPHLKFTDPLVSLSQMRCSFNVLLALSPVTQHQLAEVVLRVLVILLHSDVLHANCLYKTDS